MIPFLVFCSFLIPINAWAAVTPHLHSDLSMRLLHGVCTLVLFPLLWSLWLRRDDLSRWPALILALFAVVMVVVNSWIAGMGMGVEFGWLDHVMLACIEVALIAYFLLGPDPAEV